MNTGISVDFLQFHSRFYSCEGRIFSFLTVDNTHFLGGFTNISGGFTNSSVISSLVFCRCTDSGLDRLVLNTKFMWNYCFSPP